MQIGVQTKNVINDNHPEEGFALLAKAGFSCADFGLNGYLLNQDIYQAKINSFFDRSVQELEMFFSAHKQGAEATGITINQMHMPYPVYVPRGGREMNDYLWNVVAPKSMAVCAFFDCPCLVIHGFKLMRFLGTEEKEWQETERFLDFLAPMAKEMGITICIENLYDGIGGHLVEGPCCDAKKAAESRTICSSPLLMLSEGIKTVILGRPNAGKSSVLNLLLGEERAIVTDVAGTTRDTLEEHLVLGGISLNLMDTAGIRDTEDIVEKIGVERAMDHAKDADLILYVVDSAAGLTGEDERIMEAIQEKQAVILFNKSDLEQALTVEEAKELFAGRPVISFSAREGTGLSELTDEVSRLFFSGMVRFNDEIYITSARQKHALEKALESLGQVEASIENGMPEDFYSIDLMDAYEALGLITGETVSEDLALEIFDKFCMGK